MTSRPLAIFLPDLAPGGAERTATSLANLFGALGRVDLVLAGRKGDAPVDIGPGVRLVELGSSRTAAAMPKLAAYLRRERPATLLSALTHANVVALLAHASARVPTRLVVAEHSQLSVATSQGRHRRDRLLPPLLRRLYPRASAVVAVSEGVADDLARTVGLPRSAITVIPNPVDLDALVRDAEAVPPHPWFRREGGAPPVVLAAGRLVDAKDHPNLLAAVDIVRRTTPVRLVILGEGERRESLERVVRIRGLQDVVDLPGHIDVTAPWFAAADLFVLSSRWEGLPTVVLEALALSPRIVATDCPSGPREILTAAGVGTLVPVADPVALAAAMVEALATPPPDRDVEAALAPYAPARVTELYAEVLGLADGWSAS